MATEGSETAKARLIALYLPQYHPIPENDEWWGKGFTEWTNVTKARPMFSGHRQPKLPGELGFYDLRVPEVREAQARLAASHGIEGFCYWHYWFGGGRRLLERPFREVVESGKPQFPFCLGWANESWSGIWHGLKDKILVEQTYPGLEDTRRHFGELERAFHDPRYLTVDGKPLFIVYLPERLPNAVEFTETWRKMSIDSGLPGIYFLGIFENVKLDPASLGFDAKSGHFPGSGLGPARKRGLIDRLLHRQPLPTIMEYEQYVANVGKLFQEVPDLIPCVVPNWDNTPRSAERGLVLEGLTPELFHKQLKSALLSVRDRPRQERIVLLKSWNEWAEGNYLEPDRDNGTLFLEIIRSSIHGYSG